MPNKKDNIRLKLAEARTAGRFLVAVFKVEGDKLTVDLTAERFPRGDFAEAVKVFKDALDKLG